MYKFYKLLFMMTMILGSLISISSYSWFNMWIGLEINLLSIIPLFKSNKNSFPIEASIKYFITQALASTMILFSIILSLNYIELFNMNYWMMMIFNSALLTKMGAAPFHMWFPEVSEGLNWMNNMILLTWQKLTPMILIMYNLNMTLFFSVIIIISSILGGILGLNQISLRKILAYSSINHIAWMLASLISLKNIWFIYWLIYTIITFNIILIFNKMNIFYINQLNLILNKNKMIKIMFIFNFMSLGGLPPFFGFLPKWLTIISLVNNFNYFISFMLIISTLITLFFYIRLSFSTLTLNSYESFKMNNNKINIFLILSNFLSLMALFLCLNIYNFL